MYDTSRALSQECPGSFLPTENGGLAALGGGGPGPEGAWNPMAGPHLVGLIQGQQTSH